MPTINDAFSYSRMYKDVRAAVDLCHRDGTLKQMVAKDPKRQVEKVALNLIIYNLVYN